MFLAQAASSVLLNTKPDWSQWMYVFAPFQIYLMIVAVLLVYGDHGAERNILRQFFKRISEALERWTGHAGWAMAGSLTGLLMLGTAAIGLYWDIGFHVDYGRDKNIFTPSHMMIVLGLGGLIFAAVIAVIFASNDEVDTDIALGPIRIPWTALALGIFGIGGLAAFPFDVMWHNAYGVDVTLWSPSHIQLLAGGGLSTIVLWLMIREGRRTHPQLESTYLGRAIEVTVFGAILTGLSIMQGEFDFGVPQFQVVYLPILIAVAAGIGLVLARLAMGPWGATKTVLAYVIIRGIIGILTAGPFNETFPRFPLYLVSALLVEGIAFALGTENRLKFAAAAGLAVGTVGTAADLIWFNAISDVHATGNGLPKAFLMALLAGTAAAMLGAALARPMADGGTRLPWAAAFGGGVLLLGVLAYPLPRHVGHVEADVRLRTPDAAQSIVEVDLQPANAADSATAFGIVAWQGGGRVAASWEKVGEGRYVSSKALPITGRWKTVVGLQRGDQVMAVPVYFPKDPEIFDNGFPAVPERHEVFARNTKYLLREQKAGGAFAANAAYAGVSVVVVLFLGMYALCAIKVTPDEERPVRSGGYRPARPAWPYRNGGNGNGNGTHGGPVVPDRPTVGASWGWGSSQT